MKTPGFTLELSLLHKKMNGNIHRKLSDEREFRGSESSKQKINLSSETFWVRLVTKQDSTILEKLY
jgi:hypothetical protein